MAAIGERVGHYEIRSVLGSGGMGAVYLAHDEVLDRLVAIKEVRSDRRSRAALDRIHLEAKALARLNNPHVVQVYAFEIADEHGYIVMEYVRGSSLHQVGEQQGKRGHRQLIDCALQVLDGLAAAHEAGLVHRDIKPGNILLTTTGIYKLADFGLAMDLPREGEGRREFGGTLAYMAPELLRGGDPSIASDLYGLGVTLHQAATGRRPFAGIERAALPDAICRDELPPLDRIDPAIPPRLAAWVRDLVRHDLQERCTSAAEARRRLAEIADRLGDDATVVMSDPQALDTAPTEAVDDDGPETAPLPAATPTPMATPLATPIPGSAADSELTSGARRPSAVGRPRFGFFLKLLFAIWLISSLGTFLVGYAISETAIARETERLRQQLRTLASAATLLIDGDLHASFQHPEDMQRPEYRALRARLRDFQQSAENVRYVYTMAPTDRTASHGVVSFVIDAALEVDENGNGFIDPEEESAELGEEYLAREDAPDLLRGFEAPAADRKLTADQWGLFLSGYAPIRNRAGDSVGLVGVDASGEHILELRAGFRRQTLLLQVLALAAFFAAALIVARRFRRPIETIQRALDRVAEGDFSVRVDVRSGDELQQVGESLNRMIGGLEQHDRLRLAYERFVTRSLAERMRFGSVAQAEAAEQAAVFLHCDLRHLLRGGREADASLFDQSLAAVLQPILDHGGWSDHTAGDGLLARFGFDQAESAVRAALAMRQAVADLGHRRGLTNFTLGIGIARPQDEPNHAAERRAIALARACRRLGAGVLVDEAAFAPLRHMFLAERFEGLELAVGVHRSAIAVRGAVAA